MAGGEHGARRLFSVEVHLDADAGSCPLNHGTGALTIAALKWSPPMRFTCDAGGAAISPSCLGCSEHSSCFS